MYQWWTEEYIYILLKYENWEALEKTSQLDVEECEKYLDALVEKWEIKSWNFWEWYDVPIFNFEDIEIEDEEEEDEEDED